MANIELNGTRIDIRFLDALGNEVAISSEKLATLATSLFDDIGDSFLNQLSPDGSIYKSRNTEVDEKILKNFNNQVLKQPLTPTNPEKETTSESTPIYSESKESPEFETPKFERRYPWMPKIFQRIVNFMQNKRWLDPDVVVPGKLYTEKNPEAPTPPVSTRTEQFSGTIPDDLGLGPDDFTENLKDRMKKIEDEFIATYIKKPRESKTAMKRETITGEELGREADKYDAESRLEAHWQEQFEKEPLLAAADKTC